MLKRIIIAAAALILGAGEFYSARVAAMPAEPKDHALAQPDGAKFKARLWGDENMNGWETALGYSIVKNSSGYWVYGVRSADGLLVPTGTMATDPPPRGLTPGTRALSEGSPAPSAGEGSEDVVPPTGTAKIPVLLIDYTDTSPSYTVANFNNLLFGTNPAEASGPGSMKQYYQEASYGIFSVSGGSSGVTGWYNAANTHNYYGEVNGRDRARALAREAVVAADPTVDFSQYDNDGDGYVDIVMVVHQGRGNEESGNSNDIWSHRSSFLTPYTTNDGVIANSYTMQPEKYGTSNMSAIGVFSHEFGHALSLPDLYDIDGTSEGIGEWGMMSSGSWNYLVRGGDCPAHFCAWSKSKLGWITPTLVTGTLTGEQIYRASSSSDVYMLRRNPAGVDWDFYAHSGIGEYFLVENRQLSGFDQGLPGAGLTIWQVAEDAISDNTANTNEDGLRLVDLKDADGLNNLDDKVNRGDGGDVWPGSANKRTFNDTTTPGSVLYDGSTLGCSITNISNSGNPMTADFYCPDTDGDGISDALEGPYCTDEANADSDGDGLCDGSKTVRGLCVAGEDKNNNATVDAGETDPCDEDTDNGGENDGAEVAAGRDPLVPGDDVGPAVYNSTYTCPRCSSSGSPCVVPASLIYCRDNAPPGEPHAPNTINTSACADGTGGNCTDHMSIDGITITDLDAMTFQPGDLVRLDATVKCFTAVWDILYMFHSDSTSSVSWSQVAGPLTCPSAGVHTLSATFNLGATTGDQVVRVSFGNNNTSSSCFQNGWIDHDDVVIPVAPPCADNDSDTYGAGCPAGADACDNNIYAWTAPACATCTDTDADAWRGVCDNPAGYNNGTDPDCNDGDTQINPGRTETMCDGKDNDCNGATPDDRDGDADGLSYCNEIAWGTSDANPDSDGDGATDGDEVNLYSTQPLDWDSDNDYLPDGFEIANLTGHTVGKELDPNNPADGPMNFDGDSMPNFHDYWNGSNPWSNDPVPLPGYDVGCYYWGKGDGGPFVQPSDITKIQYAYVGVVVDYSAVLPSRFDPLDLDRSTVPDPADISLCQYMYAEANRPGGFVSAPASLTVASAPGGAVAVGDTTHVTVSVHAQGPGTQLFSPGMGVVFWVSSGNATLLGGEGSDLGEAVGNRYDISMDAAAGAPANIVVLITGPGPVTVHAKVPACGNEPVGRWCPEVVLAAPVVINP